MSDQGSFSDAGEQFDAGGDAYGDPYDAYGPQYADDELTADPRVEALEQQVAAYREQEAARLAEDYPELGRHVRRTSS
jgi:hypothetical protein